MDFSRPTNSGMTMCGYTTTSRSGSTGSAGMGMDLEDGEDSVTRCPRANRDAAKCSAVAVFSQSVAREVGIEVCLSTPETQFRSARTRKQRRMPARARRRPYKSLAESRARHLARRGVVTARGVGFVDDVRLLMAFDDAVVHDHLRHVLHRRQFVHRFEKHVFEDRAQAART